MPDTDREKQKTSLRLPILITFILLAIGIAGAGFWVSIGTKTTSELPVLKADNNPFKVKPENPGGKNIPHQDSLVLEILEGLSENDNQSEKLRLPDAAPELPPVAIEAEGIILEQKEPVDKPFNAALDNDVKTVSREILDDTGPLSLSDNKNINLTSIINDNNTRQVVESKSNYPKKEVIKKSDLPKILDKNLTHRVQLAAFSKQEKAKQQAAILMEKHKKRLNSISLEVTKIDTGSSGIYWRVITQELNETLAISTCDLLKSAGQDCIVRKIRQDI